MKAIETSHRGCRFRSRLEARWAVFFDEAGISWEHEPEGFEFPDGLRYLPDFRISFKGGEAWFEVKPAIGLETIAMRKADALARHTGRNVFLCSGSPSLPPKTQYTIFNFYKQPDDSVSGSITASAQQKQWGRTFHTLLDRPEWFSEQEGVVEPQSVYSMFAGEHLELLSLDLNNPPWSMEMLLNIAAPAPTIIPGVSILAAHISDAPRAYASPRIRQAVQAARSARFGT